ncbi:MAG: hypothetical protein LUH05_03265 [Candidatus Gastranaerophilales bacterium]|nr:hypothetical protein [Candidatus Gastranaerophilales bacterium]
MKKKPQNNPVVDLMLTMLENKKKKQIELQKDIYKKTIELGLNKKGEINE